jgi:hypothetical protein
MLFLTFIPGTDIWSVGVVLFVLLYGYPPFNSNVPGWSQAQNDAAIYQKIKGGFQNETKAGQGPWFNAGVRML